jgi:hypothetical protein
MARKRKSKAPAGWLVVVTFDGCEFEAKRELHKAGYEAEFPMIRPATFNRHGGRPVFPLFEGYCFVRDNGHGYPSKGIRCVSHTLMNLGRPAILADDELQFFMSVSVDDYGYYVDPVQRLHRVGDICFPRSGRFAGLGGKLTSLAVDGRTEMLFTLLGRKVKTTEYRAQELA